MASTQALHLFPPPPSKAKAAKKERRRSLPTSPTMVVEKVSPAAAKQQEIVIKVSTPPPRDRVRTPEPAVVKQDFKSAGTPDVERPGAISPVSSMNNRSVTSDAPTLVGSNGAAPVPMRSIFPTYNPNVPLSQQQYHPTQASPTNLPRQHISRSPYSPSMYSPQSYGGPSRGGSPMTAPATMTTFPVAMMKSGPHYSSQDELHELWESANGQGVKETGRMFALRMKRAAAIKTDVDAPLVAEESYRFESSNGNAFYDFQTMKKLDKESSSSECSVRRYHPLKATIVPVVTMVIDDGFGRLNPKDGLITTIFPRLALMMALDQVSSVKSQSTDPEKFEQETEEKTAEKERCNLTWNEDTRRYQLWHPNLNGNEATFPIQVDHDRGGPTIRLTSSDGTESLASLEMSTASLLINTVATTKIPSFYIVDVVVTAVLTVALVEGRRLRNRRLSAPAQLPSVVASGPGGLPTHHAPREEDLPRATQGALSVLFLAFQFIVWALSIIVKALGAVIVGASTCVTGNK